STDPHSDTAWFDSRGRSYFVQATLNLGGAPLYPPSTHHQQGPPLAGLVVCRHAAADPPGIVTVLHRACAEHREKPVDNPAGPLSGNAFRYAANFSPAAVPGSGYSKAPQWGPCQCSNAGGSDVEAEVQHVAFLDDVVLAFQAQAAGFLGALLALEVDEVVIADGFGADESTLEIGMYDAGGLRCGGAGAQLPRTDFLHACGEVGLQAEQLVAGADHPVQARLVEAEVLEELVAVGETGRAA